jgi:putative membrane protein
MWQGHGFFGGYMWLLWIVLIILVVWGASAAGRRGGDSPATRPSALDILKERYARGEIDSEEYERKHQDLMR